jgi:hypothetical protein
LPGTRHEQRVFLQVAREVWRHGCLDDYPNEAMDDENRRLKKMFAELSMQNEPLNETFGKK